jgi:hypothetical protein
MTRGAAPEAYKAALMIDHPAARCRDPNEGRNSPVFIRGVIDLDWRG